MIEPLSAFLVASALQAAPVAPSAEPAIGFASHLGAGRLDRARTLLARGFEVIDTRGADFGPSSFAELVRYAGGCRLSSLRTDRVADEPERLYVASRHACGDDRSAQLFMVVRGVRIETVAFGPPVPIQRVPPGTSD